MSKYIKDLESKIRKINSFISLVQIDKEIKLSKFSEIDASNDENILDITHYQ